MPWPEDHDNDFLHVRAPEFEVLPRPRLEGDDRRRPDVARTSFQSAIARSFVDKPEEPISAGVVEVAVPGDAHLPAAGTLKSVVDAVVAARVLRNDRSALLAGKLVKFDLLHGAQPVTRVEVTQHVATDKYYGGFIRTPAQAERCITTRSVVEPVAYADRSGVAGAARFQNPWVDDPEEYESQLRAQWRQLVDARRVTSVPDDWAALLLSASLSLQLPKTCTEDGDNALLYVVDMLEVAIRDMLDTGADAPTLDQRLVQVSFSRGTNSGILFLLSPIEKFDQYPYFEYRDDYGWANPFDPDAL